MKKKRLLSLIVLAVFLFSYREPVCADKLYGLPFDLTAYVGAAQEGQLREVKVLVSVEEETVLDAFTFSVSYNQNVCKLYTGNDEWMQGYGYDEEFEKLYQQSGMLAANAVEGKVLFSGASSGSSANYRGTIAKIVLLLYDNDAPLDASDICLELTALHMNGSRVDLSAYGDTCINCFIVDAPSQTAGAEDDRQPAATLAETGTSQEPSSAEVYSSSEQPGMVTSEGNDGTDIEAASLETQMPRSVTEESGSAKIQPEVSSEAASVMQTALPALTGTAEPAGRESDADKKTGIGVGIVLIPAGILFVALTGFIYVKYKKKERNK